MPEPSIAALVDQAKIQGSRIVLQSTRGPGQLRYGDLPATLDGWRAEFDAHGIRPFQYIGLSVSDPIAFSVLYLALIAHRAVVVPINPEAPDAEIERICRKARVAHLLLSRPRALAVSARLWMVAGPRLHAVANPLAISELTESPTSPNASPGILLFTSGTTGEPKGVALTEQQLLHTAFAVAHHHQLTPEDRGFCCLPLFHINAQVVALLATLVSQGTMVLDDRFHRSDFWQRIEAEAITWINAVPAIITLLAQNPPRPVPDLDVRFIRSASAPLPVAILKRFEAIYHIPVIETYGMTEAASQITANPLPPGIRKPGSVGIPVDVDLQIVDENGRRRGPNQLGEIVIRGDGVITRYAAGADTGSAFVDGWFHTGDIGHQDADGYVYIAARTREFINRGGQKIPPREVEEILLMHPEVEAAAVIGIPHPVLGEEIRAYITLPSSKDRERVLLELQDLCARHLSGYKRPAAIEVLPELPKGPTGKIQRIRLRQLVLTGDTLLVNQS